MGDSDKKYYKTSLLLLHFFWGQLYILSCYLREIKKIKARWYLEAEIINILL